MKHNMVMILERVHEYGTISINTIYKELGAYVRSKAREVTLAYIIHRKFVVKVNNFIVDNQLF